MEHVVAQGRGEPEAPAGSRARTNVGGKKGHPPWQRVDHTGLRRPIQPAFVEYLRSGVRRPAEGRLTPPAGAGRPQLRHPRVTTTPMTKHARATTRNAGLVALPIASRNPAACSSAPLLRIQEADELAIGVVEGSVVFLEVVPDGALTAGIRKRFRFSRRERSADARVPLVAPEAAHGPAV